MCVFVLTHRTNENIVNVSRSIRVVDLLIEWARSVLFINQVHVVRFFFLLRAREEIRRNGIMHTAVAETGGQTLVLIETRVCHGRQIYSR